MPTDHPINKYKEIDTLAFDFTQKISDKVELVSSIHIEGNSIIIKKNTYNAKNIETPYSSFFIYFIYKSDCI